jgi:hypothetical protein
MTTTNPNNPGLLDRATNFFKGTSKKPTDTLTSSLEHLHTSQQAQADAEAQHQADLMSGLPSEGTTQLHPSETKPQPIPREVLNDILGAQGHVPHAHHVDVEQVEKQHEQAVGPLGHVQQPTLLDKAKQAIDTLTGKTTTTTTTTTQQPIHHHPNIPHSVLPDTTLKQVQTAHGHPPHAHHVDVGTVEQRHEQAAGPLGHVQEPPSVLEKVTTKLQDLVPPTTFSSTSTSTVHTHPTIPHAAVPDQVLLDVQSQRGKVPHAQHVDVGKVEQRHDQAVGPLGHVQKEPGILERVTSKISELVPSLAPTITPATSSNIVIHTHPNIPHSVLPNSVLRDIQLQHGRVPRAHHVDINAIEKQHEAALGLGHVQDITLLHKAKHAIDSMTGKTVAPLQHRPIQRHYNIPHSALPDATLHQIHAAHGHPPHGKHVDIGLVEQRLEQRMIEAVGPLGHVQRGPTLLEKVSTKIHGLVQPTAAPVHTHPNIPQAAVPPTVLQDIQKQKGSVPHAHHVNVDKVEQRHEQAVGPLGHVQEPSLLDKAKQAIDTMTGKSAAPLTQQPIQQHENIPHAAVPDATLQQIHAAKGHVPHPHHVDINQVEQQHEQAVGPLGQVQPEPSMLEKMNTKIQQLAQPLANTITAATITPPSKVDQHPNIPHAAVPDQVLRDVEHQKGKVPHAQHVDINQVEKQHEQAIGPLGHVQQQQQQQQLPQHQWNNIQLFVMQLYLIKYYVMLNIKKEKSLMPIMSILVKLNNVMNKQ